jgi:uncharacterized cupin superfamily protein
VPVIDPAAAEPKTGSDYPPPHDAPVAARAVRSLSDLAGARDLVVNHVTLPPGTWSSQRHWHAGEDEVLVMLTGTATLVDGSGPRAIGPGEIAIFPAGDGNAHHLRNEGDAPCTFVVASRPEASPVDYPDADMRWSPSAGMTRRDGSPL